VEGIAASEAVLGFGRFLLRRKQPLESSRRKPAMSIGVGQVWRPEEAHEPAGILGNVHINFPCQRDVSRNPLLATKRVPVGMLG
jgi:hypothetical protein